MAQGVRFPGVNKVFGPPRNAFGAVDERVSHLPVFFNGHTLVSCWELSEEELAEVVKTRRVYLSIHSVGMPPVFVGSESAVRDLVADYGGVWAREKESSAGD